MWLELALVLWKHKTTILLLQVHSSFYKKVNETFRAKLSENFSPFWGKNFLNAFLIQDLGLFH